jgi:hypothetical protein
VAEVQANEEEQPVRPPYLIANPSCDVCTNLALNLAPPFKTIGSSEPEDALLSGRVRQRAIDQCEMIEVIRSVEDNIVRAPWEADVYSSVQRATASW